MTPAPETMSATPTIVDLPPAAEEQREPDPQQLEQHMVANLSNPWEFDVFQKNCAACACEFNPFSCRRHHCRFCGKIFCGKCTSRKALIPPSAIVLVPKGGKKAKPRREDEISFAAPDDDPDRMLTYVGNEEQVLYGKGLEERFKLAREPLRVCDVCYAKLLPLQEDLRRTNANAMRYNSIDPTNPRRFFNSPLAFTLGHEVRKAAYTLNNLLPQPKRMGAFQPINEYSSNNGPNAAEQCKDTCSTLGPSLGGLDGVRIPGRLLEKAKGIAALTIAKGGFGLAGFEFGSGLVVARLPSGQWSAPSAIGAAGISWGALIGAQISDHVFLLMTDQAVELMFSKDGSINLGADIGVALGPLGRAVEGNVGAAVGSVAPIYTYSLSKGLYAGVSLDGKMIVTRHKVNHRFYGKAVTGEEILRGQVPTPPAAQPLYDALTRVHVYATGSRPTRPSQSIPTPQHVQDYSMEYGEFTQPAPRTASNDDQHSFAGVSEITTDPGY